MGVAPPYSDKKEGGAPKIRVRGGFWTRVFQLGKENNSTIRESGIRAVVARDLTEGRGKRNESNLKESEAPLGNTIMSNIAQMKGSMKGGHWRCHVAIKQEKLTS